MADGLWIIEMTKPFPFYWLFQIKVLISIVAGFYLRVLYISILISSAILYCLLTTGEKSRMTDFQNKTCLLMFRTNILQKFILRAKTYHKKLAISEHLYIQVGPRVESGGIWWFQFKKKGIIMSHHDEWQLSFIENIVAIK